jgi:hypothetical protein
MGDQLEVAPTRSIRFQGGREIWTLPFGGERKAHAPLVAAASVTRRFQAVVTGNHRNRTATRGCMVRLVGLLYS